MRRRLIDMYEDELVVLIELVLERRRVAEVKRVNNEVTMSGARKLAGCAPSRITEAVRLPPGHVRHLPSRIVGEAHGAARGQRRRIRVEDLLAWRRRN